MFVEFGQSGKRQSKPPEVSETTDTPEVQFETAYQQIRNQLADELLAKVKEGTPESFERLVVKLLVRMGCGGSLQESGRADRWERSG